VLSGSRRRADAEMARYRDLLVPGIEAVGLHADGDVEIEPDLHAELLGQIARRTQLPVGGPLYEFDELDFGPARAGAQVRAGGIVGLPPFLRPFPPRALEFVSERLEASKARQQRAALVAKPLEVLLQGWRRLGLECREACAQCLPFQSGHGDVVDHVECPQARQRGFGRGVEPKFGKLFDVDIKRVEKQPAVRRIRAAIARTVVKQRMQRIETDAVGAEAMGQFDQALEVGEIADPPIAPGADAVKLDREQPAAVEIAGEGARRGHDQWHIFRRRSGIGDFKAVDAQRQALGQHDDPARGDVFGDNLLARRDFPGSRQFGARQQRGPRRLPPSGSRPVGRSTAPASAAAVLRGRFSGPPRPSHGGDPGRPEIRSEFPGL